MFAANLKKKMDAYKRAYKSLVTKVCLIQKKELQC